MGEGTFDVNLSDLIDDKLLTLEIQERIITLQRKEALDNLERKLRDLKARKLIIKEFYKRNTLRPEQSFNKIIQPLDKIIFNNKKFDIKDTIVITGSPRSGTTWLMEILRVIPRYTCLYEPFNPIFFPGSFETGFRSRTYLHPDEDWQKGEEYLQKIFTGRSLYNTGLLEKKSYLKSESNQSISFISFF